MGPSLIGDGNSRSVCFSCSGRCCFNGAVPDWRRKPRAALTTWGAKTTSFNGAVPDWRRKLAGGRGFASRLGSASMGPSLIGDGNPHRRRTIGTGEDASMGPSLIGDGNMPSF